MQGYLFRTFSAGEYGVRRLSKRMSTTSSRATSATKRVDAAALQTKRDKGEKIVVLTAYDFPLAEAASDSADVVLVGDSVGMVVHGHDSTIPVTVDTMLLHCSAVARGATRPYLVGDMPFGSYATPDAALRTGVRFIQEGSVHAVKLEGGSSRSSCISSLVQEGIPVWGHVGLTPQSAPLQGGYGLRGKTAEEAVRVVQDALDVAQAGARAVVLEMVPAQLASLLTTLLPIPTIGIGSGGDCSGQVLVAHDMLGLHAEGARRPSFVKQYANLGSSMRAAVRAYAEEVRGGQYPQAQGQEAGRRYYRDMERREWDALVQALLVRYSHEQPLLSTAVERASSTLPVPGSAFMPTPPTPPTLPMTSTATSSSSPVPDKEERIRPLFSAPAKGVRMAVVGTGAMATLLASSLARPGGTGKVGGLVSAVDMYSSSEGRAQEIQREGLTVLPYGATPGQEEHTPCASYDASAFAYGDSPTLRAACVWSVPGMRALWAHAQGAQLVPALGRGAGEEHATGADDAPTTLPAQYDYVFLCGKAGDAPEQAVAASLLVRGQGQDWGQGGPGVIIPMYNGAYTAEYVLGVLSKLRADAREGSLPLSLGPALTSHLSSLTPLGQVGYGVTANGALAGPGGVVACTGHGGTHVCVEPLYKADPSSPLLLPPSQTLTLSSILLQVLGEEGQGRNSPWASTKLIKREQWNAYRWNKLAINSILNPLVALLGVTNGGFLPLAASARQAWGRAGKEGGLQQLLAVPGLPAMAQEAYDAALSQAGRDGRLPHPSWSTCAHGLDLLQLVEGAARATADNVNSMWADGLAGRASEVHYINGAVVESLGGERAIGQGAALAAVVGKERALGIQAEEGGRAGRVEVIKAVAAQVKAELQQVVV